MASFNGGPKAGKNCKLYRNGGTVDTPSWVEIGEIEDAAIDQLSAMLATVQRRANNWTKNVASIFDTITAGFKLVHGLGETMFNLLVADFFNKTPREYLFANGDVGSPNGVKGFRCPFFIKDFPWDQPLTEVVGHEVKLEIAYMEDEEGAEIDPSWYTVAGSS